MRSQIVTLQQANRANANMVIYCPDAVHLEQMSQGLTECQHCKRVLPRVSIPKCQHGVYQPSYDSKGCSLCRTALDKAEAPLKPQIVRDEFGRYNGTRIDAADVTLKGITHQEKTDPDANLSFDRHQWENAEDPEAAMLAELCESSPESPSFFVGFLRKSKMTQAREDAPDWILNITTLREFLLTQRDAARAGAVVYSFYRCGMSDEAIAERFGESVEPLKKYRQRLLQQGNVMFGIAEQKAA
jgi:hypothetical protein